MEVLEGTDHCWFLLPLCDHVRLNLVSVYIHPLPLSAPQILTKQLAAGTATSRHTSK